MNPELFTNISKEYNEQERKLAIRSTLAKSGLCEQPTDLSQDV